jgi:hypothetical protein
MGQAGEQDPSRFHPARMMTEEGKQPGAQMPFGSGPRWAGSVVPAMCMQMEQPGKGYI